MSILSSSIFQLILYLIVFLIIFGIIKVHNKRDEIVNNWAEYRFKPYILPISGFIKPIEGKSAVQSTLDNFAEFLWSTFRNFFNILIQPIEFMFSIIKSLLKDLEKMINSFRGQLTVMRNLIIGIIMNMMKKVENIMTATIFTFGKINEMVKRQLGIYQNIIYMLQTMTITMRSFVLGTFDHMMNFTEGAMWALPIFTLGAPGVVFPLMAFCFAQGTPVYIVNGSKKPIEQLKIGDILCDGSQVLSIMKYRHKGPIYNYKGTLVTGEHFVFHNNTGWTKIKDIPGLELLDYDGQLYNLNTGSNKIYIGRDIFLDYDEYSSIDLAEKENRNVLEQLNIAQKNHIGNIAHNIQSNRRYKLGFGAETHIRNRPIEQLAIGDILPNGETVLGIVCHCVEENDHIYQLFGVAMTEWVKVKCGDRWINVRDHPNAKLNHYTGKYLYNIITSNNTIEINNELITRDFLECM